MTKTTLALCVLALCACSDSDTDLSTGDGGEPAQDLAPPVALNLTIDTYPAVDGSTSTHPLGMLIACELLGLPFKWDAHPYDGTKRIFPDPRTAEEEAVAKTLTDQIVVHNGTHGSYVNVIEKKADLALAARLPSQDELDQAKSSGVTLETKAVALDAFVFILNQQNALTSLTTKQIQEIYTGKITHWDQVGGPADDIHPYQRNETSGSQVLMKTLVMKDLTMVDAPEMILMGMMGPINMISDDALGIGYSVYFFEQFMAPNEKLKLMGVDGTVPDAKTIQNRSYPFTAEVYAVIRADLAPSSTAYKLRDWLLSAAGQAVVKKSGYVPVAGI